MLYYLNLIWAFFAAYYIPILSIYLIGGIIYAVAKWFFLVFKLKRQISNITEDDIVKYRGKYSSTTTDKDAKDGIAKAFAYTLFEERDIPPQISKHKGLFLAWAIFWPFNLLWTLFADIATEAFTYVYEKIARTMQNMTNKIFN